MSGTQVTPESICGEFLDVLQQWLPDVRNALDRLPAITFSTDYVVRQKRGKIRIVCYKVERYLPANGDTRLIKDTGIRISYFKYNLGGSCGAFTCTYPGSEYGDKPIIVGWQYSAQEEKFFGSVEKRFVTQLNGTILKTPFGDPLVYVAYGKSV